MTDMAGWSITPVTSCPKGGLHVGKILSRCARCGVCLGPDHFYKPPEAKKVTIIIKCIECGADRECPKGEAWQVKRCIPCQAKRKKKRWARFMDKVKGTKHETSRIQTGTDVKSNGSRQVQVYARARQTIPMRRAS